MFVRVRELYGAFMVKTCKDDTLHFPLPWNEDPMDIIGFDFDWLIIIEREVIYFLNEFSVVSYRKMI